MRCVVLVFACDITLQQFTVYRLLSRLIYRMCELYQISCSRATLEGLSSELLLVQRFKVRSASCFSEVAHSLASKLL